jgi:hypothetical protein
MRIMGLVLSTETFAMRGKRVDESWCAQGHEYQADSINPTPAGALV